MCEITNAQRQSGRENLTKALKEIESKQMLKREIGSSHAERKNEIIAKNCPFKPFMLLVHSLLNSDERKHEKKREKCIAM